MLTNNSHNNLAFVSIVTSSLETYNAAIRFYSLLGFTLIKSYVRDDSSALTPSTIELVGISYESIREAWFELFPSQPPDSASSSSPCFSLSGISLKIRLSNYSVSTIDTANDYAHDSTKLVLQTTDLDKVRDILASNDYRIIENPHYNPQSSNPITQYIFKTIDPIGNSIGFCAPHPAPPFEKPHSTLEASSDSSAKSTSSDKKKKKIAIMTSGGDSQGMNSAVRAVVRAAIFNNCDVFAIYDGYNGLVTGNPPKSETPALKSSTTDPFWGEDMIKQLHWRDVRGWLSVGGTLIGTARSKEFRERSGRLKAAYNLLINGIDSLVVCGGDGSLTGADLFRQEWASLVTELISTQRITEEKVRSLYGVASSSEVKLSIVGLVGSIDNDMALTDRTVGAFSALERICEMVDYIDATANSHSRAFVIEVMGRHCGWLGLMAGICTGADFIFIPERPVNSTSWKSELKSICLRHREKGHRKTTVIVAEGAIDDTNTPISSEEVKDVLVNLGLDTRVTTLGHVQRGGTACAYDRMLATLQGVEAVDALLEQDVSAESPMISICNGEIVRQPLMKAVELTKSVACAIERKDYDAAMELRDSEFSECFDNFKETTYHDDGSHLLQDPSKRLNIGIIHVGAPTSALNAATRSAALYCFSRGHKVLAIKNGFSGLIRHGSVTELEWNDVNGWHNLGGSVIGTNRSLPELDTGTVAYYFQKHQFDGLILIGGFEAFKAINQLRDARMEYPVFNLPMVHIPSTVSNNVPGTTYSLGNDTCLNELVKYCDIIKQSAAAFRKRAFVIEVQGGNCGYVAAYISLITGAIATYIPEEGISLAQIDEDMQLLEKSFNDATEGTENSGRLFIRNEKSSDIFTTESITDIIEEQSHGACSSRNAIPGHVQQGNFPSSMDRILASRLAVSSCKFIEEWNDKISFAMDNLFKDESDPKLRFRYIRGVKTPLFNDLINNDDSVCIASVNGTSISFRPVKEILEKETDVAKRTNKVIFWKNFIDVNNMLNGRLYIRNNAGGDNQS